MASQSWMHPEAQENLIRWQRTHQGYNTVLQIAEKKGQRREAVKKLAESDLFYFGVYVLHCSYIDHPWAFARCREVQASPDGHLDLWAREHLKSTIITFMFIIWTLIHDPERTFGIFAFNRPTAKAFLIQIKQELEENKTLPLLWPTVFYSDPRKMSPKWSENEGIVVKRKSRRKEASIEAWGLIDGQPTSRHFTDLHYDDIVTLDNSGSPEIIKKTTYAFRTSLNLGTRGGHIRAIGTRWDFADTYQTIIDEGILIPRIYKATYDGKPDGDPVLLTRQELALKILTQGPYVSSCQLFLDPVKTSLQRFDEQWLRYWRADTFRNLNVYILCDSAARKNKTNDYTSFVVVGLGADQNYYVIRWIRDRLSLTERGNILFSLHQQYRPIKVGYEQYGQMADIEHYEDRMRRDNYRFRIWPLGGNTLSKEDRISKLIPIFNEGRVFIPDSSPYVQYDQETVDLTKIFINDEYKRFPFMSHDDMLDCLSRVLHPDLGAIFPSGEERDPFGIDEAARQEYDPLTYGLR